MPKRPTTLRQMRARGAYQRAMKKRVEEIDKRKKAAAKKKKK